MKSIDYKPLKAKLDFDKDFQKYPTTQIARILANRFYPSFVNTATFLKEDFEREIRKGMKSKKGGVDLPLFKFKSGEFTELRNLLESKGYIQVETFMNKEGVLQKNSEWGIGSQLLKLKNKYKASTQEMVGVNDLEILLKDIAENDPPLNKEKILNKINKAKKNSKVPEQSIR